MRPTLSQTGRESVPGDAIISLFHAESYTFHNHAEPSRHEREAAALFQSFDPASLGTEARKKG